MVSILSAIITGVLALTGVIVTNIVGNSKFQNSLDKSQAVTNTKLENLTEEVKKHNAFAERIPKIEARVEFLEKKVDRMEDKR